MDFSKLNLFNFRELGGIKTSEGKCVKEGLFYRSGVLLHVSEDAKKELDNLNIKHIIDLRNSDEAEKTRNEYLPSQAKYTRIGAITKRMMVNSVLGMANGNNESSEDKLSEFYNEIPFGNDAYKFVFGLIKNDELPILFHCTGGKDRTGVLAALILLLLGVDREVVVQNYLDSIPYLIKEYGKQNVPITWLVKREWIESCINNIYLEYKTIEEYFYREYGLTQDDIKQIRNRCLK